MQLQKPSRRARRCAGRRADGGGVGGGCGGHVVRNAAELRGARVPVAAVADDGRSQLARAVDPQLVLPACTRAPLYSLGADTAAQRKG